MHQWLAGLSLHRKVWIAVVGSILVLLGLFIWISDSLYLRRINTLEHAKALEEGRRGALLLEKELDELMQTNRDYSEWVDTLEFLRGNLPAYAEQNWTDISFNNLKLQICGLFSADGTPFQGVRLERGEVRPMRPEEFKFMDTAARRVLEHPKGARRVSGIINFEGRLLLFVCSPVLLNGAAQRPQGALFSGRWVEERVIKTLGEVLMRNVTVLPYHDDPPQGNDTVTVRSVDQNTLAVSIPLRGFNGEPVGYLEIKCPRTLFNEARSARYWTLLNISVTGIVIGVIITFLLHRLVLGRIERVCHEFGRVSETGSSSRLKVDGKDEIARLAVHANTMLDAFQAAEKESRRLHDQLVESQKLEAIGRFAGGIAHDFNNCLTSVFGSLDLCLMEEPPETIRARLEEAKIAAQHASAVVAQLLAFSHNRPARLVPIDLDSLLHECMPLIRSFICNDVAITCTHELARTYVSADTVQVQQALVNLARNASDAMNHRGKIHFSTVLEKSEEGRNFVGIRVSDTGRGIEAEAIPRLFEPFYTTKRHGQGFGLGLTVVKQVADNHSGSIAVTSAHGKGTTFQLNLPVVEQPKTESPQPVTPVSRQQKISKGRILIAEDDAGVRAFVETVLVREGYDVVATESGPSALKEAKNQSSAFDLLLTDFSMPGMTGHQLGLEFLKVSPHTPVVLMSGFVSPNEEAAFLQAGISAVMHKPLTAPKIKAVLSQALTPV